MLILESNLISDINILDRVNFTELKELNLSYNKISDIKAFENAKFNKLEILYLEHNYILYKENELIIKRLNSKLKNYIYKPYSSNYI